MRVHPSLFAALSITLVAACHPEEDRERDAITALEDSTSGAVLFARAYGGADATSAVAAHSVTTGPGGDIWISGDYVGTVDFGAGAITSPSAGAFVTRFDPDGNARWTVPVDSEGAYRSKGIAVDADGNAFVGSVTSLTKLSPTGEVLWRIKPVERPRGAMFDEGDIAADGAGGVVLLGWSEERLHFGAVNIPSGAFVLDVNGRGELRWSNRFHQTSSDYLPIGLAVDGEGNTVVAQGTNKGNSLRLTKIDRAGATRWLQRVHGVGGYFDVGAAAVATDPQGGILFAGGGHARFDAPSALVIPGGAWLAKLDPAGGLLWWKQLPIWAVTADAEGDVLLVSGYAATKLDPAGSVLWSRDVLAGVGDAVIAGDTGGRMIVAGTFTGALDIEGRHLSSGAGKAVVLMAFGR